MQIPVICSLSIGIPKTASRPCTTYLYTLLRHMGAMGHSSHETHTHLYLFCTLSIHCVGREKEQSAVCLYIYHHVSTW